MAIEGQTNVRSMRVGSGSIDGLGRELGRFAVATMELPWALVRDRLGATPAVVLEAGSMEIETLDRQVAQAAGCDTLLAIGGGRAVDLGKYASWKLGVRLVTVPTILSVDAFTTPAAGVRRDHRVEYAGTASPDPLVIDYDLIRQAPADLNIAGVGDLLSIHTASFDWELAERSAKSEYPFNADAVARARALVADLGSKADAIAACTDEGLQAIVDGCIRLNTICLPAGHFRVEEGSEHYLFYELEERLRRPFVHGWIVGLGVYLLSRLQGNRADDAVEFMRRVGLRHQPKDLEISRADLEASLLNLRAYVERRGDLWWTVINEREITGAWVKEAVGGLEF